MTDGRFAINIHILTLLSVAREVSQEEWLSSEFIAGSINVHPVLVRKEVSNLRQAGFVQSKEGKNGGIALARSAQTILLSDVYKSVYDKPILGFAKNTPNPKCPIGARINEHLTDLYNEVEKSVLEKLGNVSLQQFTDRFS